MASVTFCLVAPLSRYGLRGSHTPSVVPSSARADRMELSFGLGLRFAELSTVTLSIPCRFGDRPASIYTSTKQSEELK